MNIYDLSRRWFDFCFENPEKITPSHTAIFFFAIEHCNRLGWKEKFGFPTQMAMDAIGVRKHQTYIKHFNNICEWGFFNLIEKSTNQYSANIISLQSALPKNGKALGKALDKARVRHGSKQGQSTGQSSGQSKDSIDIQLYQSTNTPIYKEREETHAPENHQPLVEEKKTEENPQVAPAPLTTIQSVEEKEAAIFGQISMENMCMACHATMVDFEAFARNWWALKKAAENTNYPVQSLKTFLMKDFLSRDKNMINGKQNKIEQSVDVAFKLGVNLKEQNHEY